MENDGWENFKDWSPADQKRHAESAKRANAEQTPEKEAARRGNVVEKTIEKTTGKKNSPSNKQ